MRNDETEILHTTFVDLSSVNRFGVANPPIRLPFIDYGEPNEHPKRNYFVFSD